MTLESWPVRHLDALGGERRALWLRWGHRFIIHGSSREIGPVAGPTVRVCACPSGKFRLASLSLSLLPHTYAHIRTHTHTCTWIRQPRVLA